MRTPLKTFWMLQKNIDRLEAAQDYRTMQNLVSATSGEHVQKHMDNLKKIIGKVVIYDQEATVQRQMREDTLDQRGLSELRGMGKLR